MLKLQCCTYVAVCEVHDVWQTAALSVSQADAVLQDDVASVVLSQDGVHLQGGGLGVHLVQLLSPLPQVPVMAPVEAWV